MLAAHWRPRSSATILIPEKGGSTTKPYSHIRMGRQLLPRSSLIDILDALRDFSQDLTVREFDAADKAVFAKKRPTQAQAGG
jgi:hypothetical protein